MHLQMMKAVVEKRGHKHSNANVPSPVANGTIFSKFILSWCS